jgi:hypothetical protein
MKWYGEEFEAATALYPNFRLFCGAFGHNFTVQTI